MNKRRFDPGLPRNYQDFANSPRLQRIYLDEMTAEVGDRSLGFCVLQLIGVKPKVAPQQARQLITRVRQELTDAAQQRSYFRIDRNGLHIQISQLE